MKFAVEAPAGTETLAGTGSAVALLLASVTANVLVAALLSVTVQVVVCPGSSAEGVQASVLSAAGATADKVNVRDAPPAVAVTTALRLAAIDPTVAVKVLLVKPLGTVTFAGT